MTQVWDSQINSSEELETWKALNFLNLYRLTLSGLFFTLVIFNMEVPPLATYDPKLFLFASGFYLLLSLLAGLSVRLQWPNQRIQTFAHVFIDIVFLTILMHASGGTSSGLGMLLILPIASGSILTKDKTASAFAALASLCILTEHLYSQYFSYAQSSTYAHIAFLSLSYFAISIITFVLVDKIKITEAIATQRGIDLANLAQLNEHIVQEMHAGIIVVDQNNTIHLMNHAAWYLLGNPQIEQKNKLENINSELNIHLQSWINDRSHILPIISVVNGCQDLLFKFTQISDNATFIFLEDNSVSNQRAQQLKLASLGRLTASIAHEIRNPLAAISHAGELLNESSHLTSKEDIRLTQIIHEQCNRLNTIIKNILQISRKEESNIIEIALLDWMMKFRDEFCNINDIAADDLLVRIEPKDLIIRVDPLQFHQVLWNLCQNALNFTQTDIHPKIELLAGKSKETANIHIDILDHGPGIDETIAQEIFEPFFTTSTNGTGLGLYIARELCANNNAHLNLISSTGGTCFRINFNSNQRQVA